jgi:hypothetical protein
VDLRYARVDRHLSQITILTRNESGWTIETRRESAAVAGPRRLADAVAARLIEFGEYGYKLVRRSKRRTVRGA